MIKKGSVRAGLSTWLVLGIVAVAALPAAAQLPVDLVFYGNIVFENDACAYGTESGGAGCAGGLFTIPSGTPHRTRATRCMMSRMPPRSSSKR